MLFDSSDRPLADQRSVMVAETRLERQDQGEPAVFQVSVMYKVPALLLVLLLTLSHCALQVPPFRRECPVHPFAGW
jgi:hypothetical protein